MPCSPVMKTVRTQNTSAALLGFDWLSVLHSFSFNHKALRKTLFSLCMNEETEVQRC